MYVKYHVDLLSREADFGKMERAYFAGLIKISQFDQENKLKGIKFRKNCQTVSLVTDRTNYSSVKEQITGLSRSVIRHTLHFDN